MKKDSRFELRINSEQLKELRAFADTNEISLTDLITLASLEYVRTKSGRVHNSLETVRTEKPIVRTKQTIKKDSVRTEQKPADKPVSTELISDAERIAAMVKRSQEKRAQKKAAAK